jgi:hypothetical protein
MSRLALAALATAAFVCACAPMPPAAPARGSEPASLPAPLPASPPGTSDWVLPNDQLLVQGIPPIPRNVAEEVARYGDFRGHAFVDWHPTRREMLVGHRKAGGNTTQIYRLASPMVELEPVTDFADPVRRARYEPLSGDSIVFERSVGGDEAAQIYRLDLATRQVSVVSEPDMRHSIEGWLNLSSRLFYLSLPLDRTAEGGRRTEIVQTLTDVEFFVPVGEDGKALAWPLAQAGEFMETYHQTWGRDPLADRWRVDVFREPWDDQLWVFRRDERIQRPVREVIAHTADSIPYACPEVALLFKAKWSDLEKNKIDFSATLPLLDAARRAWLAHALEIAHPEHPWLADLS